MLENTKEISLEESRNKETKNIKNIKTFIIFIENFIGNSFIPDLSITGMLHDFARGCVFLLSEASEKAFAFSAELMNKNTDYFMYVISRFSFCGFAILGRKVTRRLVKGV